jgi:hypothetical protein
MASSARVTSVQAIADFKVALLGFCQEAKEVLSTVEMEIRRTMDWVQRDQLPYWQREIRNRHEEVAQAKADLFRKQLTRISGQNPDYLEERKALRLAHFRLEEAEDKVQICRSWANRQLKQAVDEYEGPARQLAGMVEGNPPPIVIFLDRIIGSLEAYLEVGRAPEEMPPPTGDSLEKSKETT